MTVSGGGGDALACTELRLDRVPKTLEEIRRVEGMLLDPRVHRLALSKPEAREAIADFVLRLKEEREVLKRRKKFNRKQSEGEISTWLSRYLSTFNCIGWIGLSPGEAYTRDGSGVRPRGTHRPQEPPPPPAAPAVRARDWSISSLETATVEGEEATTREATAVFSCTPKEGMRVQTRLADLNLSGIKLRLDGYDFPGATNLSPEKCQDLAEILLQTASPYVLYSFLSNYVHKIRVVHEMIPSCKRYVHAYLKPSPAGAQLIELIRNVTKKKRHLENSGTQTESLYCGDISDFSVCSYDKLDIPLATKYVDARNNNENTTYQAYSWIRQQFETSKEITHYCSADDDLTSSKESFSDNSDVPVTDGARLLSKVFRESKVPETSFVTIESVFEGSGVGERSYPPSEAASVDSLLERRRKWLTCSGDSFDCKMKASPMKKMKTSEGSVCKEVSSRKCNRPPEISTGFSELSCPACEVDLTEGDSDGRSFIIGSNGGIINSCLIGHRIVQTIEVKHRSMRSKSEEFSEPHVRQALKSLSFEKQRSLTEASSDGEDTVRAVPMSQGVRKLRTQREPSDDSMTTLASRQDIRRRKQVGKQKQKPCVIM